MWRQQSVSPIWTISDTNGTSGMVVFFFFSWKVPSPLKLLVITLLAPDEEDADAATAEAGLRFKSRFERDFFIVAYCSTQPIRLTQRCERIRKQR